MREYLDRIEELFEADPPEGDETGSLEELASAFTRLDPRLLVVVTQWGEIRAAWNAPGASDPPTGEEIREAVAAALPHTPSRKARAASSVTSRRHRISVVDASGTADELIVLGWFGVDPGTRGGKPAETWSGAARLAARAIRSARRARDSGRRERHLENEQRVLVDAHYRNVAEMLDAKEKQVRQQREYVSLLEREVERRSADLREALRHAEAANEAKNVFLANMSHEIRTPMTAILGYTDLLLDPDVTADETAEYVEVIRSNGEHLVRLLDEILDIANLEARRVVVEYQHFDVRETLEQVVARTRPRAEEKGLSIVSEVSAAVPPLLYSDPGRIDQIVRNLVVNAISFTEDGSIRIAADYHGRSEGGVLEISVIDTGPGLDPDEMGRLFEPFVQADSSLTRPVSGLGLGLPISRNLARLLGGDITVTTRPRQGSTFRLIIRLGETPAYDPPPDDDMALVLREFLKEH